MPHEQIDCAAAIEDISTGVTCWSAFMSVQGMATGLPEGSAARPDPKGVIAKRVASELEGDFVVFLIGMRINRLWKLHKWLPVFLAMPRMLKELKARPESGLLGYRSIGGLAFLQYWRSFDHLEAFARAPELSHWPAWTAFNRRMSKSRGDVGIWHETYLVRDGEYEAIYSGMPPFGLGKVGRLCDATGARETARQRLRASAVAR
jgi:hypothetical protein